MLIPPKQVKAVVEEYLKESRQRGFRYVRIIHGKGIGTQREMVRTILARAPSVISCSDAPPEAERPQALKAAASAEPAQHEEAVTARRSS